jgi:hypothetical protein
MRNYIEIELKQSVDPFDVQKYLIENTTMKVHVVDNRSIRIWYNEDKMTSSQVVKTVCRAANGISKNAA